MGNVLNYSNYFTFYVVLAKASLAAMKHHEQKTIGEGRVYLTFISTLVFITEESRSRTQTGQKLEGRS